jgi:glutamate dehydrogenase
VTAIEGDVDRLLPERIAGLLKSREDTTREAGVPAALARRVALLPVLAAAPDVLLAAEASGCPVTRAAAAHFEIAEELRIARIVGLAHGINVNDYYDGLALDHALALLAATHRRITTEVLGGARENPQPFAHWLENHKAAVERFRATVAGITEGDELSVARLVVAANLLGDLART